MGPPAIYCRGDPKWFMLYTENGLIYCLGSLISVCAHLPHLSEMSEMSLKCQLTPSPNPKVGGGGGAEDGKDMEPTDISNYHLSSSLAFIQVKTTSPESYRVRPSSGVIPASSSAEVSVFLQPGKRTLKLQAENITQRLFRWWFLVHHHAERYQNYWS